MCWTTLLLAVASDALAWGGKTPVTPDVKAAAKANNEFSVDFYGQLRSRPGNVCFSPYSISTGLTMAYAGARAATAEEMAKSLRVTLPQSRLHPAVAALRSHIDVGKISGSHHLTVANRLWIQSGYRFQPEFLQVSRTSYSDGVAPINLAGNAEVPRNIINAWIHKATHQKIPEVIPRGALPGNSRLVLTNVVYLKANWASPFNPGLTKPQPFHLSAKQVIDVPTMYQQEWCKYGETEQLRMFEFPYRGEELSMLLIVPVEIDGLAAIERGLPKSGFSLLTVTGPDRLDPSEVLAAVRKGPTKTIEKLHWRDLQIFLPKFTVTADFDLQPPLQTLGMKTAFDDAKADFSGITRDERLHLSCVVHKTFVSVNEVGTEAAAATVGAADPFVPPLLMRVDRPFLFAIRHNRTKTILFLGRVVNPKR